jgi:hypothetical protein
VLTKKPNMTSIGLFHYLESRKNQFTAAYYGKWIERHHPLQELLSVH